LIHIYMFFLADTVIGLKDSYFAFHTAIGNKSGFLQSL